MNIGMALRMVRKEKGHSQEDVAHLAGYDRSYISMVETGKACPTIRAVQDIAQAMGWSASQIVELAEKL